MAITDQTRKVLWALSGNACARCDTMLVRIPEVKGDIHAIVGRECHIVARSMAGPRGKAEPRGWIDHYNNLILLCANCHAIVDGQPEKWTPESLREMKRNHEQNVERRGKTGGFPKLQFRGRDEPLNLDRIDSGDALVALMDRSFSHVNNTPTGLTWEQRELVGNFLQSAQDWSEIVGEIGPKGFMDAGGDLQDQIDRLREHGLIVYGTVRTLKLVSSAGDEDTWPESVLKIVHQHEALEPSRS